jgi:hypothetical protein
VGRYCRAGKATDDNMANAHCMLDTYGYKQTHTYTHTHTHSGCVILIAFPQQHWLNEGASMLRCTYVRTLRVLCFLFILYSILCYKPPCHNCNQLATLSKFMTAKILLQCCKQEIITWISAGYFVTILCAIYICIEIDLCNNTHLTFWHRNLTFKF